MASRGNFSDEADVSPLVKRAGSSWLWGIIRALGLAVLLLILVVLAQGWVAFGKAASGERLARMQRSPNYRDGRFVNPQPLQNDFWGMLRGLWHASEHVSPSTPPDAQRLDPSALKTPPASGLR